MWIDIITLFPGMFLGPLQESILKRAQQRGLLTIVLHHLRDYAFDRHQMTDDVPYGGGAGMVLKPEPLFRAVEAIAPAGAIAPAMDAHIILLTPQGRPFTHALARELAQRPRLLFLCGHYEGVDERVREHLVMEEISLGDYVLTGGELAAMVIIDAVARWLPGVLGAEEAASGDSYASGLLEGPQYTRPAEFRDWPVPEVLRSGHHAAITRWQREQALRCTAARRPDLLAQVALSPAERALVAEIRPLWGEPDGD